MNYNLKQVQEKLVDLLQVFHDFCVENHITYYIAYGTLIGAVRHQGFIPWDDDVDVMVSRKDYQKIIALWKEGKFPQNTFLKYNETTEDLIFPYAMFLDSSTTLVYAKQEGTKDMVEGLYIDIFPLDGAGNSKIGAVIRNWRAFFMNKLLSYSQESYRGNRFLFKMVSCYAQKQDPQKLHQRIEDYVSRYSMESSKYFGLLTSAPSTYAILTWDIMGEPKLYPFGKGMFYGPEDADRCLTLIYGDYMKFPPKEQQVSNHSYKYINFDLPFAEYSCMAAEGRAPSAEDEE